MSIAQKRRAVAAAVPPRRCGSLEIRTFSLKHNDLRACPCGVSVCPCVRLCVGLRACVGMCGCVSVWVGVGMRFVSVGVCVWLWLRLWLWLAVAVAG